MFILRISFFSLIFLLIGENLAYAQEDEPVVVSEYETVIVSAKRIASLKRNLAENTIVFTASDIEQLPARDLSELLTYMPGIDSQLNGQFGQSTSLSINGSSARQVLLMVDGIPFNTQLSGQASPTQIPLEHIERVELIKGASSSAWGSGLGGVVNVITKDVGDTKVPRGTYTTSYAEFATTKNSLSLSGALKEFGYFLSGSYFRTNGILDVSDVEEKKFFGKLKYDLNDQAALTGSFGYSGADVFYGVSPTGTLSHQPYNTRYGKFKYDFNNDNFRFDIAYKYNDQTFTTNTLNPTTKAVTFATINSNKYHGLSLNGSTVLFDDHVLVFGSDFDWHILKSNNFLSSSKSISMQAPYVNYTLPWNNFDFIGGLRHDHNQQFGSQTSPSLGVVYDFKDTRDSVVRGKISRAFNAPPLLWIYNQDTAFKINPNPDLKAEKGILYELGFDTKLTSALDFKLSLYRTDVKDAIARVVDSSTFFSTQENFEKFRRQGGQLLLDYKITDEITFYGSGAFNDVENRATGETVRDQGIARQRYTFGLRYGDKKGWRAHLSGYYNRWSSSPSLEPNDRKPIFNLRITKEFKNVQDNIDVEAFLSIHNLTNRQYWSSKTFPLAEKYIEGGVSLRW